MQVAKVVPLTRLPARFDVFDYLIPPELSKKTQVGSLVKIELRGRPIVGVVFGVTDNSVFALDKLKPITSLVQDIQLARSAVETMGWLADELLVSQASIANAFVPEPPLKLAKSRKPASASVAAPITLPKEDLARLKKHFDDITGGPKGALIRYHAEREKNVLIYKLVEKAATDGMPCLLISPQISGVLQWQSRLASLKPRIWAIHGGLNKTQMWDNWSGSAKEDCPILVGTRQAALSPFHRSGFVIFEQAESDDLKQSDQNPRYDARLTALDQAERDGSRAFFFSQTPPVNLFFRTEEDKRFPYIDLRPPLEKQVTRVIDLKSVQKEANPYLSLNLLEAMTDAFSAKKKVLLILNRKGLASALVCQDCAYTPACPNCHVPFAFGHENLYCRHCQAKQGIPIACPRCAGTDIKAQGHGLERIEKSLRIIFPERKIRVIDSENPDYDKDADITMATTVFLHRHLDDARGLGLVAILSLDNLLNLPDFAAGEKAVQIINRLAHYSHSEKIPFLLQSYYVTNPTLIAAVSDELETYLRSELAQRKQLGYPPYKKLIKLLVRKPSEKEAIAEADRIKIFLMKKILSLAEFFGPGQILKIGKNYTFTMTIKCSVENWAKVRAALRTMPDAPGIDTSPISLL